MGVFRRLDHVVLGLAQHLVPLCISLHCSMSCMMCSSISLWLQLPLPLPGSSDSSPTSRTARLACWLSSTTQYRSRFSPDQDCNRTTQHISSSATRFFPCDLLACFLMLLRSRVLYGHSRHGCKPVYYGDDGLRRQPVGGQWHAGMVVCIWKPPDVLIDLLPQCDGGLHVQMMSRYGGRLQCIPAPIANAYQHAVLNVQCDQIAQFRGNGLGLGWRRAGHANCNCLTTVATTIATQWQLYCNIIITDK